MFSILVGEQEYNINSRISFLGVAELKLFRPVFEAHIMLH
jgi:hypothetical protein